MHSAATSPGGKAALLLLLLALASGAGVPLAPGGDWDLDPTLLYMEEMGGSFLVVFARIDGVSGPKINANLYLTRADSLDAALQGQWSAAQAIPPALLPGIMERAPDLFHAPGGLVGLFYTSDQTGLEQVYMTTAPPPGVGWSMPLAPLPLGEPAGTATRWPAALEDPDRYMLVYEAEGPGGPAIHANWSHSGISWNSPVTVAASGRRPSVTRASTGEFWVVFEDGATGRIMLTTSPTGGSGTWTPPQPLPVPDGREAAAMLHWDDRTAVYASAPSTGGAWSIQRTFRAPLDSWTPAEELDEFGVGLINGAPDPVAVGRGMVCAVFDSRSDHDFPPATSTGHFWCTVDLSCTEAPHFDGVQGIEDPDPCQTGMLVVDWDLPLHFGSARISGARYYVYRGTAPNFVPAPENRVAGPLFSTFYIDTFHLPDTRYWYVVRAENLEDCPEGNGPRGGMMEGNLVRVSAYDPTPRPPGDRIDILRAAASRSSPGSVRLAWSSTADAAGYNLYRMDGEAFRADGLELLPGSPVAGTEVEVERGGARLAFFAVKPVSVCGIEGE